MRIVPAVAFAAALLAGCLAPAGPALTSTGGLDGPGGFSSTSVFEGEYRLTEEYEFSRVLEDGPLAILDPQIEAFPSDLDGEQVLVGYFLPDVPAGTRVPTIVFASPYLFNGMTPEGMEGEYVYEMLVENFVPHGYAVAYVPVRGTSDTGGCMDLMGDAERGDLNQAVTWIGEQPWSNGAVGMIGASYDGSTPWQVASFGNPYLKTIVPVSGVNDWFTLMYNNGTVEWRGPLLLNALYYEYGFLEYNAVQNGRQPVHMVKGAVCPESWKGFAASLHSSALGERDALGFWAERNSRPGVEANYQGSILMVQGLQDWNVDPHNAYPWTNELEAKGIVVKHMLGQWGHAFPDWEWDSEARKPVHPRTDWAEILLHWFDYWLKGDTTADLGPKVQVQDSSGQWRNEDSWPPADAVMTTLHLAPDGALAAEPASGAASKLLAVGNPDWEIVPGVPVCPSCPSFATEPMEQELRFAGIPQVHVTVKPTAPSQEVAAWLFVVEGGERDLVGWGAIDVAFPAGGEKAKPAVPGQPIKLAMVLEPLDVVVPEGATLELVLHASGGYGGHAVNVVPATLEVGGDASVLRLPVIERDGSTFFEPPSER